MAERAGTVFPWCEVRFADVLSLTDKGADDQTDDAPDDDSKTPLHLTAAEAEHLRRIGLDPETIDGTSEPSDFNEWQRRRAAYRARRAGGAA